MRLRVAHPPILWISVSAVEGYPPPDGRDLLTRDSSGRQQHQQGSAGCCDVGSQPQGGQDALAEMPAGQRQGGQQQDRQRPQPNPARRWSPGRGWEQSLFQRSASGLLGCQQGHQSVLLLLHTPDPLASILELIAEVLHQDRSGRLLAP